MRRLFGCPDIVSLTEKFLMARNFYRIFTENNPVMGDSKTFGIPEAKGLSKQSGAAMAGRPWPAGRPRCDAPGLNQFRESIKGIGLLLISWLAVCTLDRYLFCSLLNHKCKQDLQFVSYLELCSVPGLPTAAVANHIWQR